jgi:HEAT repeat protein
VKHSLVAFAVALIPSIAAAQAPKGQAPPPVAAIVKEARDAERHGRFADAVSLADRILEKDPGHREAASIKIDAHLAAHNREAALGAYEQFVKASRADDTALLSPIAKAELQALSASSAMPMVSVLAQERLARTGDPSARANLVKAAKTERNAPRGRIALLALARLGDRDALRDLEQLANESHGQARIIALQNLSRAPQSDAASLFRRSLGDRDPLVRVAALDGLAELQRVEAKTEIRTALTDTVSIVRLSAAVALRRMGDATVDDVLTQALKSALPDIRLVAARAFVEGADRTWVASIEPVLSNPDGLNRIHAAALLLRDKQTRKSAVEVLAKAGTDENPAVRAEAARVLAEDMATPASILRPLLRDPDLAVRLHAAVALLTDPAVAASPVRERSR